MIDITGASMKRVYANPAIQSSLVKTIATGADRDMLLVAKILHRYFSDTGKVLLKNLFTNFKDKGTVPIELAKPMLKFIVSYLTLVNSMVEIQRTMRITDPIIMSNVHSSYMGLFSELCTNFGTSL
jgi:murein endopeptidase